MDILFVIVLIIGFIILVTTGIYNFYVISVVSKKNGSNVYEKPKSFLRRANSGPNPCDGDQNFEIETRYCSVDCLVERC